MNGRTLVSNRRGLPTRSIASLLLASVLWLWVSVPAGASLLVNLGYAYLRLLQIGDVVEHDIHIRLEPWEYKAYFTDEVTIRATKSSDTLYMILGVDYVIDRVTTVDGQVLPHRRHISLGALPFIVYRIDLDARVARDELKSVRFEYHITPDTAQFSFPYISDELFFTTIAMLWYPQMPNESYFMATVHLDEAPPHLVLVGEGEPVPGTDGLAWRTVKPVPGIGVAIGRLASAYHTVDGRDIYAWHTPGQPGRSTLMAIRTGQAISYLEQLLGPLPAQRLDIVAFPYGIGGSTGQYSWLIYDEWNPEIPLENEVMLTYMAAHEAAHKWIGFTAGMQVLGTTWITEGLTDYLAFLTVEAIYGPEAMREVVEARSISPLANHEGRIRALSSIELTDADVSVAYQKGALVFRALHRRLGDERFFGLLRTFLAEYTHEHATPRQFTDLIEREGGESTRRFVADWVNGANPLDYALQDVRVVSEGNGERLTFKVVSVGRLVEPGPVQVLVRLADGLEQWIDAELGETVSVRFDQPIVKVVVDPDYWVPDWYRENNLWEAQGR